MVLSERLKNARLHRFPLGQHEVHQKYPTQFVQLMQEHILNPTDYNLDAMDQLGGYDIHNNPEIVPKFY